MSQATTMPFVDRRDPALDLNSSGPDERRQFTNSHDGLSPPAQELAQAIDGYKLTHRRRFITYEEMFQVISSLGYAKQG
jgi:hypothetical protein